MKKKEKDYELDFMVEFSFEPQHEIDGLLFYPPSVIVALSCFSHTIKIWEFKKGECLSVLRLNDVITHLQAWNEDCFVVVCRKNIFSFSLHPPHKKTKILRIDHQREPVNEIFKLSDNLYSFILIEKSEVHLASFSERKVVGIIKDIGDSNEDITTIIPSGKFEDCFYINLMVGKDQYLKLLNINTLEVLKTVKIGEDDISLMDVSLNSMNEEIAYLGFGDTEKQNMSVLKLNLSNQLKSDPIVIMEASKENGNFYGKIDAVLSLGNKDLFSLFSSSFVFKKNGLKKKEDTVMGSDYLFLEILNKNSYRVVSKEGESHQVVKISGLDLSKFYEEESNNMENDMKERTRFLFLETLYFFGEENCRIFCVDVIVGSSKISISKSLLLM